MLSARLKPAVTRVITPVAAFALRRGITPNAVTWVGAIGVVVCALYFYPRGDFFIGTVAICILALSDLFDGTMARLSSAGSSKWGEFLDSTIDRITDSSILLGVSIYLINRDDLLAYVVLVTLVTGLLVPYIRAKAESFGIPCSGGIAERTERLIISLAAIGFDGLGTSIGRTILLTAISNSSDMLNYLSWKDYEDWLGNVMSYNIYRGIDGVFDPTPIANVPFTGSGFNTYTDDISMLLQGQGVFDYYVEALEGMGNPYGFSDNSISNVAEAFQDPIVFIPNAFKPSGFNSVFLPVTTYVDITAYQFDVFNRWGLNVFSTTNIDQGWDGTNGGVKQELGVYVYLVRFRNSKGEYLEFKGSVTLLR